MTNREVIIKALQEHNENIADYIECPYSWFEICLNEQLDPDCIHNYEDPIFKARCRECKMKWLDKEWNND